jgi:hypothetical protein
VHGVAGLFCVGQRPRCVQINDNPSLFDGHDVLLISEPS